MRATIESLGIIALILSLVAAYAAGVICGIENMRRRVMKDAEVIRQVMHDMKHDMDAIRKMLGLKDAGC